MDNASAEGERGGDLGNDAWIYFSDDVGHAKGESLTHFEKFVGRSNDEFTFNGQLDLHNEGQPWMAAVFPEAGEYTLNLAGRSSMFQVDRIILYKGVSFDEAEVLIGQILETFGSCEVVGDTPKPITGIDHDFVDFMVYPNPTKDKLTIRGLGDSSSHVSIYNTAGYLVMDTDVSAMERTIDVSHLKSGLYILRVAIEGEVQSVTFMRE